MDHFAGLDVSVKETSVCIVDDTGKIVREVKVASEPNALLAVLKNPAYHFKRIGLEAGPLSQWLCSAVAEAELPVVCVETRHMQAVLKAQINKTDRNDARGIAQMMRVGLYRPVHVKTLRSQKLQMLLTHRKLLQSKTALVATELKGPDLACRHWTIGLATGGDHSRISDARRGGILSEPYVYRLAVAVFVNRENVGAFAIFCPARQRVHRHAFISEWRTPVADEVYSHVFVRSVCVVARDNHCSGNANSSYRHGSSPNLLGQSLPSDALLMEWSGRAPAPPQLAGQLLSEKCDTCRSSIKRIPRSRLALRQLRDV